MQAKVSAFHTAVVSANRRLESWLLNFVNNCPFPTQGMGRMTGIVGRLLKLGNGFGPLPFFHYLKGHPCKVVQHLGRCILTTERKILYNTISISISTSPSVNSFKIQVNSSSEDFFSEVVP